MFALTFLGDVIVFVGGVAVGWMFKDKILAFVAKVKAKI